MELPYGTMNDDEMRDMKAKLRHQKEILMTNWAGLDCTSLTRLL